MGDTAGMWGDMLGLGPILTALKDPDFLARITQLYDGLIELDRRTIRLEMKLDAIGERIGVDFGSVDHRPAVPAGNGAARDRPDTSTGRLTHDGNGESVGTPRQARG